MDNLINVHHVPKDTLSNQLYASHLNFCCASHFLNSTLDRQLQDFLHGSARVLLLLAPAGAGKTWLCHLMARKTKKDEHSWVPKTEKSWVPVFIDLPESQDFQSCVERALLEHGLHESVIAHAKATRSFLLLIEGFDKQQVDTNLYVRYKLDQWGGKAVFTCSSSYIGRSPQRDYYFMPSDSNQLPNPHGLQIIHFDSKYSEKTGEIKLQGNSLLCEYHFMFILDTIVDTAPEIEAEAEVVVDSTPQVYPNPLARQRWQKAVKDILARRHLRHFVTRYTKEELPRYNRGMQYRM